MDTLDANSWLADHGDYLFRVARRQLHSDELAEDAGQKPCSPRFRTGALRRPPARAPAHRRP
jgi:DNA-directed RNA polymerase specialized sigma24 family protein